MKKSKLQLKIAELKTHGVNNFHLLLTVQRCFTTKYQLSRAQASYILSNYLGAPAVRRGVYGHKLSYLHEPHVDGLKIQK